ncbi:carboxypeptidase-like regulatory domain-containing protein [Carboxylicivirga sp. A043]|uniref:M56 family metallopeptidase n=1 Tax=Carboxylicivirga litoralis TaxID=2816963 RepID=UPI0021CB9970|nr:M56 family metallopeptidase [Carboxylicivirga sp. A043]MCU4154466.1 carboxypeptidase-like regulatory domain-containing protein [Carboxylicivirga sp. A043]
MELFTYLSRSFLILLLFLVTYQLLLRNDAHYKAVRFFLLLGLVSALCLPLAELKYTVFVEPITSNSLFEPVEISQVKATSVEKEVSNSFNWFAWVWYLYIVVTVSFVMRLAMMLIKMLLLAKSSHKVNYKGAVVCIHPKVEMPFVFGNRIFIKHERYLSSQNSEIINHERVHLNQQHWIDVIMSELFIVFQWFNPFAWYYARVVKQNLEFLADQGVLESGHNYEDYIQTIICETMGAEASVLANHFRFSQNKRRLKMMKNDKKSKWRLLKLLLVLPMVGGLLWAFSEPVYEYRSNSESINDTFVQDKKDEFILKGNVFSQIDTQMIRNVDTGMFDEKVVASPLPGTSIVIKGTTTGTVANMKGQFELPVSVGDEIVFSFVGFETKVVKVINNKSMDVMLSKSAFQLNPSAYRAKYKGKVMPPPPPPTIKKKEVVPPPPPPPAEDGKPVFYVVEEMPSYKGGMDGYFANLYTRIEQEKKKASLTGTVKVQFTVGHKGGISQTKALERLDEKEAKLAVKIVSELTDWKPGMQRGKPVSTTLVVPVEFE